MKLIKRDDSIQYINLIDNICIIYLYKRSVKEHTHNIHKLILFIIQYIICDMNQGKEGREEIDR
jgi:hypothetical protein